MEHCQIISSRIMIYCSHKNNMQAEQLWVYKEQVVIGNYVSNQMLVLPSMGDNSKLIDG